jgi:hypothetical protein
VRPVAIKGELEPTAVSPLGLEVTVYVGVPVPRTSGGVKVIETLPPASNPSGLYRVAVPIVGAPGAIPALNPNFRVAPLPTRFTKGTSLLMQILTGLRAW